MQLLSSVSILASHSPFINMTTNVALMVRPVSSLNLVTGFLLPAIYSLIIYFPEVFFIFQTTVWKLDWIETILCCSGCTTAFYLMGILLLAVAIVQGWCTSGSCLYCQYWCVVAMTSLLQYSGFPLCSARREQPRKVSLRCLLVNLWWGWRS